MLGGANVAPYDIALKVHGIAPAFVIAACAKKRAGVPLWHSFGSLQRRLAGLDHSLFLQVQTLSSVDFAAIAEHRFRTGMLPVLISV
jgi:hypothetical protein